MRRPSVILAALAALLAAGHAATAAAGPPPAAMPYAAAAPRSMATLEELRTADARAIREGLARAVRGKRLTRAEAARYWLIARRARATLTLLPGTRGEVLERVFRLVRLHANVYTRPRALALFAMLEQNAEFLATRPVPPNQTDVTGKDGVVYRVGWGYGLQFHPLANAGALNAHVQAGRDAAARRLTSALLARSVARGGAALLEYYFPFGSGSPPWTSGMAQAAAAQAFARAFERFGDPALAAAARRAFASIPGRLLLRVASRPWIRHYSFSGLVVLNAHMQATVSLADYARITGDEAGARLASTFAASAKALLPRFDTGYWTLYSLGGAEAPLNYHRYHVDLAGLLAGRTGDPYWNDVRARFDGYTTEPTIVRPGARGPVLYPSPAEGFRDEARVPFWLSKVSSASLRVGGRRYALGWLRRGWHTFAWRPGRRPAGEYRPAVDTVDLAGNRGGGELEPVTIAVDRSAPVVAAKVVGRRLTWRATDGGSPWVRMRAVARRNGAVRQIKLGVRPKRGTLLLPVPRGTWGTVLWVSDSTGNRTRVPLGPVPAPR